MNYDVIIVGAGPGGSQCARKLAQAGLRVAVYDRRQEIGAPKRCGEGVDTRAEEYTGKIPENCIRQRINGFKLFVPDGRTIEVETKISGYILERKVFDKWLAIEASKAGAYVRADSDVHELIIEGGKVVGVKGKFIGEPFEARADVIVIATGAESRLARQAGFKNVCNPNLIDTCMQYEIAGAKIKHNMINIVIGKEIAPRGYIWFFSKGDTANIGIGIVPGEKSPKYYLDKYIDAHPGLKGSIIEVNAGIVPLGGMLEDMAMDGALIIGEAALLVNPIHGGGIHEALISGDIAADVITAAHKKKDFTKKSLGEFNGLWHKKRGVHLKSTEKLREIFDHMDDKDMNDVADAVHNEDLEDMVMGKKMSVMAKVLIRKPKFIKMVGHLL